MAEEKVVKLELLKDLRIKEHRAEEAKVFKVGDVVEVSGIAVSDLLGRGIAKEATKKSPNKEAK